MRLAVRYAWNQETFEGLALDGETPILGLFKDSHMRYQFVRTGATAPLPS